MRSIKFRGKSILKKWVYGSLIIGSDGVFILEEGNEVGFQEPTYHQDGMGCGLEDRSITDRYEAMAHGWERAIDKCAENYQSFTEVIPETVGQYTELPDKHGNEIWEGDIVIAHDHPTGTDNAIGNVIFTRGAWGFKNSIVTLGDYGTAWTEVIGNIHDNPELLKK